jgi:hydrogenase maturation protease
MNLAGKRVLILCYGNPGRLDDGLGAAFGREFEKFRPQGVDIDIDYQLNVEDAMTISEYDSVVFVDACINGQDSFQFSKVEPKPAISYTSHSVEPEHLLSLAEEMFGSKAEAYALGIRGYEFNSFGEKLSSGALRNLDLALDFMKKAALDESFRSALCPAPKSSGEGRN